MEETRVNEAQRSEHRLNRPVRRKRWIKQTTFYQPDDAENPNKGNCTEAAVASLLGIPLPHKFGPSGDVYEFWTDMDACFERHGFWALRKDGDYRPDGLYLASGPSARGCSHMVVMRAGKLVHDPHPSDAGLLKIEHVWLAVPIDPAMPPNAGNQRGA
jgi:hypothetical protein